jgi:hypothetical protein
MTVMFNTNFATHSFFVVILQPMSVCSWSVTIQNTYRDILDKWRCALWHFVAVRVIESQKQALTQQTTAHKTVMALKEDTRKDLEVKFRNVHALIKKNGQYLTFVYITLVNGFFPLCEENKFHKTSCCSHIVTGFTMIWSLCPV